MHTWLITGCSSGFGLGIAKAVLRRGDQAVVTARNTAALDALVRTCPERVLPLRLDLNDPVRMKQVVQTTCRRFGTIDVLVNNAGHGYRAAVEESEPQAVAELFETNFFGPMELIRLVFAADAGAPQRADYQRHLDRRGARRTGKRVLLRSQRGFGAGL